MGWMKAEGRLMSAKTDTVRISVREVAFHRRTPGTRNRIIFYIGFHVAQKCGFSSQARVNLFWGDGKDEGWCRLEVAHDGRFKIFPTHGGHVRELSGFFFKTQQHPLNGGVPMTATECGHIIAPDGALLIKPPARFWKSNVVEIAA